MFFTPKTTQAQQSDKKDKDSVRQRSTKGIKEKFPSTRILNFEYGQSFNRTMDSKLFEEDLNQGKIRNQSNFRGAINFPLFIKGGFSLLASGRYAYHHFDFSDFDDLSDNQVFEKKGSEEFHYITTALSATYFSKLFNKSVIYNASVFLDDDNKGFERVKGFIGLSFILKQTERTTLTLGGVFIIDPTSQIPFFPTFSYSHRFKNSEWQLDFILPQRLLFRRPIGKESRLSLGSTFGVTGFYVHSNNQDIPPLNEYSQLEIKTGFIFEHRFNNFLIGTFRGGLQNFISNRLTEKGKPTKDHIYKNSQHPTGYFQVGFSIDPFSMLSD